MSLLVLAGLIFSCGRDHKVESKQEKFTASDSSLTRYQVPEWYLDAKLGYWVTWGVYTVPAFAGDHAAEWYGRWMYTVDDGTGNESGETFERRGLKTAAYHREKYGDPAEFGYKDLAPMFRAEKWDPEAWADLFAEGGARFFTMMGTFCDNYCMWDSETVPFNSVNVGPKRDLVGEMKAAVKKRGMHFGVSSHSSWNDEFFKYNHISGFDAKDPSTHHIYGNGTADRSSVARWWERTTELIDKYQPDLVWFDWCWNGKPYTLQDRLDLTSYYYNEALEWNQALFPAPDVVLTYKNRSKMPAGSAVLDLERGGMSDIEKRPWMNDTSLGLKSWSYAPDEEYRSANQVVDMLMDIISKNGILLLNVGPKADGTIPPEAKIPVQEIGDWLKTNGEAVYATRPWEIYGEGPTVPNEKMHGDQVEYTARDIRFTRNKENTTLYATFLGWSSEDALISCLGTGSIDLSGLRSLTLLNTAADLTWIQKEDGLHIRIPDNTPVDDFAYAIKMEFSEVIPKMKSAL